MDSLTDKLAGPGPGVLRSLLKALHFVIIASGCIMALTFFSVVILPYIFEADLFAYEEWLLTIAFWMFFTASAVATHNNAHITADILGIMLKRRKTVWLRAIAVKVIELMILLYLSYLGTVMLYEEFIAYPMWQMTIALKIPFAVPRLGIALGIILMTFYTILHLYLLLKEGPDASLADEQPAPQE